MELCAENAVEGNTIWIAQIFSIGCQGAQLCYTLFKYLCIHFNQLSNMFQTEKQ